MPTLFISYARSDANFTLKVARDLVEEGLDIWLDQFRIKAGDNWDEMILKGLAQSSILIVVLSRSSIDSKNVLDEIHYGLSNDRILIPILYNECRIPFRLDRLQRIDFTGDYSVAIHTLTRVLKSKIEEYEKERPNRISRIMADVWNDRNIPINMLPESHSINSYTKFIGLKLGEKLKDAIRVLGNPDVIEHSEYTGIIYIYKYYGTPVLNIYGEEGSEKIKMIMLDPTNSLESQSEMIKLYFETNSIVEEKLSFLGESISKVKDVYGQPNMKYMESDREYKYKSNTFEVKFSHGILNPDTCVRITINWFI